MNNTDFIFTSQLVIKLEKLDEKCLEIYTEIPQIIKQEPEFHMKSELPEEVETEDSSNENSIEENSQSQTDNDFRTNPESKPKKKKYGPYKKPIWIPSKMTCKICNVTLSSKQSFNYHNNAFHSNKPKPVFQCHMCPRSFPQNNFLLSHLRTHKAKNIFECDICGKNKLSRLRLVRHMAMHRTIMNYQCDICPKAFKSKKYISRHIVTHIGEFLLKFESLIFLIIFQILYL